MKKLSVLDIYKLMDEIVQENPTCVEYEQDARYTYPRRWRELKKAVMKAAQERD